MFDYSSTVSILETVTFDVFSNDEPDHLHLFSRKNLNITIITLG